MEPMSTFTFLLGLGVIAWGFIGWLAAFAERSERRELERMVYDDG